MPAPHAPRQRKTAAEISAVRRAAALKGVETRRANSPNKQGRPRSVQIRVPDYNRLQALAAEDGRALIDEMTAAVDALAATRTNAP